MKKIVFSLLALFGFGAIAFAAISVEDEVLVDELLDMIDDELANIDQIDDEELANAITLLHSYEITKFDTIEAFMPSNNIRRDEAAKMYVNFAKNSMGEDEPAPMNPSCVFTDLHLGHSDLPDLMMESCNRGLFKGYLGAFMPTDSITNAQAVIVLIRMIDGTKEEPVSSHYATNYMAAAEEMNLLEGLNISSQSAWDQPASRATIAKLLFRADSK